MTENSARPEIVEVPVLSDAVRKKGVPLSLVTRGGGLVFVSGVPPLDPKTRDIVLGDIATQSRASLVALEHCLKAAGSHLSKVLMIRIYAANAGFYGTINAVYAEFFANNPPGRTFVPVASWPNPFDIEIEGQALA